MPWCPICKNEYRAGFKTCAECKVELVESLEEVPVAIYFGNERELTSIVKFLKANDYEDAVLKYDETDGQYEIYVKKENEKAAKRMIQIFYRELQNKRIELEELLEEEDDEEDDEDYVASEEDSFDDTEMLFDDEDEDDEEERYANLRIDDMELVLSRGEENESPMSDMERIQKEAMELKKQEPKETFKDKHMRADEYKASAQALFFVGVLGIVFFVVNILGILPFQLGGIAQYVLLGMCLFFIIFACHSLKESKKLEKQAGDDDATIEQMKTYLNEQLSKEKLDEQLKDILEGEEQLYFARTEYIKEELTKQFGEKYQPIIDKITDDYYEELYS